MSEDQFTKLFKYMENRFDDMEKRFDEQDKRFDDLTSLIDSYAQEMAAMDHKINRLERYIQILADKVGVDLDKIHA